MLNAHSEIMTSCGLGLEKAANLEDVLSIKFPLKYSLSIFPLKYSLSIFAIAHLQSPGKVDVLPAQYG